MSRTKNKVASTLIALSALVGAFVLTEQKTPGFESLFPGQVASNPAGSANTTIADQTVQSDAINYQYGTIQVELVSKSGKISAINMLQSGATAGREQAFTPLIQAAIQAQGSNFGNLTGATMTTGAFKQAITNAMSKLK